MKRQVLAYVSAVLALTVATNVLAAPGSWKTTKADGWCSSITSFEDNTVLAITLNWRTDQIGLYFLNENWKSLSSRVGGTVDMHVQMSGNVEYDKWFDKEADVADGEVPGFHTSFAKEHKFDFLASWAFADAFALRADDINLGSFTLRGSKDAMFSLAQCAAGGLRADRSDPFAK